MIEFSIFLGAALGSIPEAGALANHHKVEVAYCTLRSKGNRMNKIGDCPLIIVKPGMFSAVDLSSCIYRADRSYSQW